MKNVILALLLAPQPPEVNLDHFFRQYIGLEAQAIEKVKQRGISARLHRWQSSQGIAPEPSLHSSKAGSDLPIDFEEIDGLILFESRYLQTVLF